MVHCYPQITLQLTCATTVGGVPVFPTQGEPRALGTVVGDHPFGRPQWLRVAALSRHGCGGQTLREGPEAPWWGHSAMIKWFIMVTKLIWLLRYG